MNDETVAITNEIKQKLKREKLRTGLSAIALFKSEIDIPIGLTSGVVNRWLSGLTKTASRNHLDYVIGKWSDRQDDAGRVSIDGSRTITRGRKFPKPSEEWINVTDEMAAHLRAEFVRTGVDYTSMLDDVSEVPDGLSSRIIKGCPGAGSSPATEGEHRESRRRA
jgi:hypothetical protein